MYARLCFAGFLAASIAHATVAHGKPVKTPPTDTCNPAPKIPANAFSWGLINYDVSGATVAGCEAQESCTGGVPTSRSVWYEYTPPCDGVLYIRTPGSDYDTVLSIFDGCASVASGGVCLQPGEIGCNDDVSPVNLTSSLSVPMSAGTTYKIKFADYSGPGPGSHLDIYFDYLCIPSWQFVVYVELIKFPPDDPNPCLSCPFDVVLLLGGVGGDPVMQPITDVNLVQFDLSQLSPELLASGFSFQPAPELPPGQIVSPPGSPLVTWVAAQQPLTIPTAIQGPIVFGTFSFTAPPQNGAILPIDVFGSAATGGARIATYSGIVWSNADQDNEHNLGGGMLTLTAGCTCPGDMNGDDQRNGLDVQQFIACLVEGGSCACADIDGAPGVTPNDVPAFVNNLIAGGVCP
jgi:hypothetical protein